MARVNKGNGIIFDSSDYTPITLQYGIKKSTQSDSNNSKEVLVDE